MNLLETTTGKAIFATTKNVVDEIARLSTKVDYYISRVNSATTVLEKNKMKENILWAPWRIGYIAGKREKGCLFCRVKREKKKDKGNYILFRGKYCLVMLNTFPYNNGHLMIAPFRHIREPSQLKEEETIELWKLVNLSIRLLKKLLKPEGFNVGLNLGKIAGAGFPGHLHIHIVPRWSGDTNFMPVVAKTKVISQSLEKLYKELTKLLRT